MKIRLKSSLRQRWEVWAFFVLIASVSFVYSPDSFFALEGKAKEETGSDDTVVRAELLLGTKDLSRPFTIGLRFELAPDWYLYWINPGDAGLAPEIRWFLPPGFQAERVLYPVPQKFVSAGTVSFGYKKEVILLAEIRPRPGFHWDEKTAISAEIDWLVCRESCLRGLSRVEIFPARRNEEERRRAQKLISLFREHLPLSAKKLGLSWGDVKTNSEGHNFKLEASFALAKNCQAVDFFPYPLAEGTFEHAGIRLESGKLILPLVLFDPGIPPVSIKGLLVVSTPGEKGHGYEVEIPLKEKELKGRDQDDR